MSKKGKANVPLILGLVVAVVAVYLLFLKPAPAPTAIILDYDGEITAEWVATDASAGRTTGEIIATDSLNISNTLANFGEGYATLKVEVDAPVKDLEIDVEQGTADEDFLVTDMAVVQVDPESLETAIMNALVKDEWDNGDTEVDGTIVYEFARDADVFVELTVTNDASAALTSGTLATVTVEAGDADRDYDEATLTIIL